MQTSYRIAKASTKNKLIESLKGAHFIRGHSRMWMAVGLGTADLCGLVLAGLLAILLRGALDGKFQALRQFLNLAPLWIVVLAFFAWRGLYPGVGLSPVEELRRLTVLTSVVFLLGTAVTFWIRTAEVYSRSVFGLAWIFSLILLPVLRALIRNMAVRLHLWGEPVGVVGYGPQGRKVVDFLCNNLRFGLRPVAVIDGFESSKDESSPIPVLQLENQNGVIKPLSIPGIRTLVLVTSEMPEALQDAIVEQQRFGFKRLILIPNLNWVGSVGVIPYDLEGFLGLEVRQNLLNEWEQALKRVLDLSVVFAVGVVALPLFGALVLLISLDSKGSAFYSQDRIGKRGQIFKLWKFRTMVCGAEKVLQDYLSQNPEARHEWRIAHKLKYDPRVTRIGRFLRRTSLDELPQLWNVLKGEMSLVGPRPIVNEEIEMYQDGYRLYRQVRPGMTGLWQVSGRNDVGYDDRVRFDEYYVRNWSIWLDIYVLIRTCWAVVCQQGAY
jgi:Undecaprenyl-phosphate galactose phosphotransferase WbaP